MIAVLAVPLLAGLTLALFIVDQRTTKDLHWSGRWLLIPWLYFGLALDVALNATVASVAFLELPHEWTLSARVKRHEHDGSGWRQKLATWVCANFLRPIDPDHC